MTPLYEDNHIIIVDKVPGEIVQGDKTGDKPLPAIVGEYLKDKYAKPGNVFVGVVHRLDRPVGGVVMFAKTSKALARLNDMLRNRSIHKTYWAIVEGRPENEEATLSDRLVSSERNNKTYVVSPDSRDPEAREAKLHYRVLAKGQRYSLLEINLITGRKHQIRVQLSNMGYPIKGDLKYGAKRSNRGGGISLLARNIRFIHPVSKQEINVTAPLPSDDPLWQSLLDQDESQQNN